MLVKQLASRRRKRPDEASGSKRDKLWHNYLKLEAYDRSCLREEGDCLAGIDEVGRGAFAGPVVAAAVVLPRESELVGVNDSKKLSEDEREAIFPVIVQRAIAIGISYSHPALIDRVNVLNATLMAMAGAAENLRLAADLIIIDGRDRIDIDRRVIPVIGGDGKSLSIAAASLVAKVARDRLMRKLHKRHPLYNFISNKGYGTKEHIAAIVAHGMTPAHRRTYCVSAVENTPGLF